MRDQKLQLSIIIVSWNVKGLLRDCLRSIQHFLHTVPHEVIVVDNASTDGSADMVAGEFPQIDLIRNKQNIGFGRANNLGLAKARGKYVFFLNDDTKILDANIVKAIHFLEQHPETGLVGVHLLNPDGTNQPSVRHFPKVGDQLLYVLKLHVFFPRAKSLRRYLAQDFDYTRQTTVDQIMGAAMLAPTNLIKELGGFDPKFPNWFEEVDLCKRVQQKGLKVQYLPIADIVHVKGASFAQQRPVKLQRVFNYSMRRYFRKWEPWWAYVLIVLAQPVSIIAAMVVQIFDTLGLNVRGKKAKHL